MTDENMTGADAEGVDWGGATPPEAATWSPEEYPAETGASVIYPEHPPLPEASVSINFKITGEPMITVRGWTGREITSILNDLTMNGVWANIAAAQADLRVQGGIGAGLGPVSAPAPQGPPPGPPQGQFQAGPPQQSQGAPPPWAVTGPPPGGSSYPSPPPQQQQWQGGGGGNFQQDDKPQPAMQPPGWYRVNARSGPGFDNWKALREAQKDYLKGKIKWGGKADYWIEPSIAQWLAGQGFAVTQ